MPSYGIYRTTEKKCATCAYWPGEREIQFVNNKQYYIKAISGSYDCGAQKGRKSSSATYCLKWRKWPMLE